MYFNVIQELKKIGEIEERESGEHRVIVFI